MTTPDTIKYMRDLTSTLKPKQTYTLMNIAQGGYIPWAKDHRTIVRIIEQDRQGANLLDAQVEGEGRARRYLITGKNLKNYLNKTAPVLMHTVRKPKQNVRKNH